MKYTPGPWKINYSAPSAGFQIEAPRRKVHGGGKSIVTVRYANRYDEAIDEAHANARLIEQAPAMLKALTALEAEGRNVGEALSRRGQGATVLGMRLLAARRVIEAATAE